jgi:uncharacterized protein (DUF885 family)
MHRLILLVALTAAACGRSQTPPEAARENADAQVRAIADRFLEGFFERYPEQVTLYGVSGRSHAGLTDNSLAALARWEAREDAWLEELRTIDTGAIASRPLRATYAIVRESIESAVASRICRNELWQVSQMNGWQVGYGYLVTIQPVGSAELREAALARWRALPAYIDTEIVNLRDGLRLGYTAPRHIVRIVIDSVRTLAATPPADSPFLAPVRADKDPAFVAAFTDVVNSGVLPAARRYADFLEQEYLLRAREAISVAENPNGAACYAASVRAFSTLPKSAREVHELGLAQVARIDAEMSRIVRDAFGQSDVSRFLQQIRTDRRYTFRDRAQLIAYSQDALARAKAAAPQWFGRLPTADVRVEPYPAFRERSGAPGEYNPPAEDGSRGGLFYINAYEPRKKTRADNESTAFHETIPGHHLQIAIALENTAIHPIGRYSYNSGYGEGWALYAEVLADEMKLFSGELDRLGMFASQNWRAVRLVVDSGLHAFGWSRQQAIDYMLAHTTANLDDAASEIDRYIIWPGQATAYMLGQLEILAAREEARKNTGASFDIKAFHDRVLEDGTVPLVFLRTKLREAYPPSR